MASKKKAVKPAATKKPAARAAVKAAPRRAGALPARPAPKPAASLPPTEMPRVATHFNFTPQRDRDWQSNGLRPFLQYRDLGLRAATDGQMKAEHVRGTGPTNTTGWHCHDLDFQLVYCLKGFVRFKTEDDRTITLKAGDGAYVPPLYCHNETEFSDDYEVLQITAPADYKTIAGRDAPRPRRAARKGRVDRFAVGYDRPEAYKAGDGPRAFLAYRDIGVTEATGRRVNINIVRMNEARDASTGWHYHTLSCQFIYVLKGWTKVVVEGEGEFTLRAGDAMTIPHGVRHDVPGFSDDFTVLELNMPADYDTIATAAPAAA
jgi:quercetin dioxygenase-like cupin family protein